MAELGGKRDMLPPYRSVRGFWWHRDGGGRVVVMTTRVEAPPPFPGAVVYTGGDVRGQVSIK